MGKVCPDMNMHKGALDDQCPGVLWCILPSPPACAVGLTLG